MIPPIARTVADAILAAPEDERREIALGMLAYSLGALAAMEGKPAAAEIGYRYADALVAI